MLLEVKSLLKNWDRSLVSQKSRTLGYCRNRGLPLFTTDNNYGPRNVNILRITTYIYSCCLHLQIAYALTRFEYCRTDQRFEHSYTLKAVIFQFINYYGALFGLVLLKAEPMLQILLCFFHFIFSCHIS